MRGADTPFVLVVVGAAGSGKSTIARELARRLTAAYLDKDSLAGPLVDAAMSAQGESTEERESNVFYREQVMPAEYDALFRVASDNLRLGLSVVIDAPFAAYIHQPDFFNCSAERAQFPEANRLVLQIFASEDETRRRLTLRGLSRDRAKLGNWDEFWSTWGRSHVSWTDIDRLELENEEAADFERIMQRLRQATPQTD